MEYSYFDDDAVAGYQDKRYSEETDLVKAMARFGAQCVVCCTATKDTAWESQSQLAAGSGKMGGMVVCGVNQVGNGYTGGSVAWSGRAKGPDNRATKIRQCSRDREQVITVNLPMHLDPENK